MIIGKEMHFVGCVNKKTQTLPHVHLIDLSSKLSWVFMHFSGHAVLHKGMCCALHIPFKVNKKAW